MGFIPFTRAASFRGSVFGDLGFERGMATACGRALAVDVLESAPPAPPSR